MGKGSCNECTADIRLLIAFWLGELGGAAEIAAGAGGSGFFSVGEAVVGGNSDGPVNCSAGIVFPFVHILVASE